MSYIPEHIVQEIRNRIDILEIINEHLSLKKKGQNYWACCPFHDEKTPSFSVAPHKNLYKCFGCGKSGDGVSFLMEIEQLNYAQALRKLAEKYHIAIPEIELNQEQQKDFEDKQSIYALLKFATEHYQKNLHTENGKIVALSYLRERGLTPQIINEFALGYALDEWENLKNTILKNSFQEVFLERAGLLSQKNDKKFDRFRNRIIFPIQDVAGRFVGFGARAIKSEDQPKYLNSPESEVYHKSEILYGLFQAKAEIRKKDFCFLTEGYLDVISMHQLGFKNTVASSGTSLTEQQVKAIKRFTENITILYDGDTAGQKAALRAVDIILAQDLNVKIVALPKGEDPDSFAKKHTPDSFEEFIKNNQQDFINFKKNFLLAENPDSPTLKNNAINEILNTLALIPNELKISLFLTQISDIFAVEKDILKKEFQKRNKQSLKKTQLTEQKIEEKPQEDTRHLKLNNNIIQRSITNLEKETIRLLLLYGNIMLPFGQKVHEYLFDELSDISYNTQLYIQILELYQEKLDEGIYIDFDFLRQYGTQEMVNLIADWEHQKYEISPNWAKWNIEVKKESENLPENLYRACLWLKYMTLKHKLKENLDSLETIDNENWEEIQEKLTIQMNVNKQIQEIGNLLGNVIVSPFFIN